MEDQVGLSKGRWVILTFHVWKDFRSQVKYNIPYNQYPCLVLSSYCLAFFQHINIYVLQLLLFWTSFTKTIKFCKNFSNLF